MGALAGCNRSDARATSCLGSGHRAAASRAMLPARPGGVNPGRPVEEGRGRGCRGAGDSTDRPPRHWRLNRAGQAYDSPSPPSALRRRRPRGVGGLAWMDW
jgi:hypothetical protein